MRRNRAATLLYALALVAVVGAVVLPQPAKAIPAFARKYNFSCTTCHAPMPRLKDYGDEFAGNGFRLPEGEEPVRAYRDTGDPQLTLQRDLPVAVRLDAYATLETEGDRVDLKTPWGVKLLSGGSVAPSIGYYFYFYLAEEGEVAGVEDAYLHFNDLGGIPLDLMIGQFQISDPMMKRELRLTFEDYEVYRRAPGFSGSNLTYDRGIMATYEAPAGFGLVAEVVNGSGLPASRGENFDTDRDKGYLGRVTWGYEWLSLGGFYYFNHENLPEDPQTGAVSASNEVEMVGSDVGLAFGDWAALSAQYIYRTDSDPGLGSGEIETQGAVGELIVFPEGPDGRFALVGLFNWIDSDDDATDYRTLSASAQHVLRRNFRLNLEYTYDLEIEESRLVLGFVSAF